MDFFNTYFTALQQYRLENITEHSHRAALQALLQAVGSEAKKRKISILHEPKRQGKYGSPDFMIKATENIIGYVENKKLTENLENTLVSEQIKKYSLLSDNLLLTNYIDFIWLRKGEIQRASLCYLKNLENKQFILAEEHIKAVYDLLKKFFSTAPQGITKVKTLATALAERTKYLKAILEEKMCLQKENEQLRDKIWRTYETFKQTVYENLSVVEFSDTFAQTITYGLFLARLNDPKNETITLRNIDLKIPKTFSLIKDVVENLRYIDAENYPQASWIIEEILNIINTFDIQAIRENLSFAKHKKTEQDYKDPYIHFYENFLAQYNPALRKGRGVYYTPNAVVYFIVQAMDAVLKDKKMFNISKGIASYEQVKILDFASGTGTFLFEILEQINDKFPFHTKKGQKLIETHINNLYGFEVMMASYIISHIKISEYLKENGFEPKQRLRIVLTNTLEKMTKEAISYSKAMAAENELAKTVKDKEEILVITGNPPYAGHSANASFIKTQKPKLLKSGKTKQINSKKDTHIGTLLKDYYQIEGKSINEKNTKWIQDDYVKFIRFAQNKIEQQGKGLVAIVTNHAFLDNPTFKGMRYSLMKTFNQIYIIDLHGNSKKKEKTPTGEKDENVFDIQQGVCVTIFIKKEKLPKKIMRTDFWGKRHIKNQQLYDANWKNMEWQTLQPTAPFYLFAYQNEKLKQKYRTWHSIKDIFIENSVGIVTARDKLCIQFSKAAIKKVVNDFAKLDEEEARKKYNLGKDARDWTVKLAQEDLIRTKLKDENIKPISYRPFDTRYTYYTGKSRGFQCMPRGKIMQYMVQENIGLVGVRQVAENVFNHVYITKQITDFRTTLSNKGGSYVFPLYVYRDSISKNAEAALERFSNISHSFWSFLKKQYNETITGEELVAYIYAILHSDLYRKRYINFLRIDYARIPFCEAYSDFEALVKLGQSLIAAHLLENIPDNEAGSIYESDTTTNSEVVVRPKYKIVKGQGRLYINDSTYFAPISAAVNDFRLGGYQVLHKYLKERKGRSLDISEIDTIENIAKVAVFTLEQAKEIDAFLEQLAIL